MQICEVFCCLDAWQFAARFLTGTASSFSISMSQYEACRLLCWLDSEFCSSIIRSCEFPCSYSVSCSAWWSFPACESCCWMQLAQVQVLDTLCRVLLELCWRPHRESGWQGKVWYCLHEYRAYPRTSSLSANIWAPSAKCISILTEEKKSGNNHACKKVLKTTWTLTGWLSCLHAIPPASFLLQSHIGLHATRTPTPTTFGLQQRSLQ